MVHFLLDPARLLTLEADGRVTATFRRLDPPRQEAVMTAILAEACERGPSRVRLKETALAAGVSVGSLYQYFGNRDGVLSFATELVSSSLASDLRSYIPQLAELALRDGLTAWAFGGMEWTQQQAAVMGFFVRGAYEGDPALAEHLVEPVADAMLDAMRALLRAAVDRGEARPDLPVDATARAVHVLLSGVVDAHLLPHLGRYFQVAGPHTAFEETLAAAVELIVAGVRP